MEEVKGMPGILGQSKREVSAIMFRLFNIDILLV